MNNNCDRVIGPFWHVHRIAFQSVMIHVSFRSECALAKIFSISQIQYTNAINALALFPSIILQFALPRTPSLANLASGRLQAEAEAARFAFAASLRARNVFVQPLVALTSPGRGHPPPPRRRCMQSV
jgi:hypothetical protein